MKQVFRRPWKVSAPPEAEQNDTAPSEAVPGLRFLGGVRRSFARSHPAHVLPPCSEAAHHSAGTGVVVWRRYTGGPSVRARGSIALILLLVVAARASRGAQRSPSDTFEALVQRYIEVRRDAGALSRAAIDERAEGLKRLLREVRA